MIILVTMVFIIPVYFLVVVPFIFIFLFLILNYFIIFILFYFKYELFYVYWSFKSLYLSIQQSLVVCHVFILHAKYHATYFSKIIFTYPPMEFWSYHIAKMPHQGLLIYQDLLG